MKNVRWSAVAVLTVASLTATAAPGWAENPTRTRGTSDLATIMVTVAPGTSDPTRAAASAISATRAAVTDAVAIGPNTVAVTVNGTSAVQAEQMSAQAEERATVLSAEVSRTAHATTTNDTYYSSLWNINNQASSTYGVKAENAWSTSRGAGAVIGVIDTGITTHSDVKANVITGYDFVSYGATSPYKEDNGGDGNGWDSNPTDEGDWYPTSPTEYVRSSWHGTHVAGTAAAIVGNAKGVAGVAPSAFIEPIRVLGWTGGRESDIIAGINWGAGIHVPGVPDNKHPADVLNLSLGGSGTCSSSMQSAINAAVNAGTAVVVAAGNGDEDGNALPIDGQFPANCNNVIRVTATNSSGAKSSWSNYGTASFPATVAAPGVGIYSTVNNGAQGPTTEGYGSMDGTSMAAPHVSGILALLRSADARLTPAQLKTMLTTNTTAVSGGCSTTYCGAGIANAAAAIAQLAAPSITSVGISGAARVGVTVTAAPRASTHSAYLKYQWLRDGTIIAGATRSTLALTTADFHHNISVTVTATVGSASATRTSGTVNVSYGTFAKSKSPKVKGTMRVGKKLTAYAGAWSPKPSTVTYQWLRDGKKIKHATKAGYRLTSKDRGHKISVRVTVKRSYYTSRTATSAKRRAS
ncbi:MAG TPA: peptidase S8 [Propionibacteriaceae bacterium]|nr:peptidase S8 [Propionibacteriaceae bacterium]